MGCNFQFGVVQLTRSILLQCRHYCRKVVGTRRKWHQRALWLRPCTLCRLRRFQIQPPFVLAFVRFRTTDDERKQVETTTTIKHSFQPIRRKNEPNRDLVRLVSHAQHLCSDMWSVNLLFSQISSTIATNWTSFLILTCTRSVSLDGISKHRHRMTVRMTRVL